MEANSKNRHGSRLHLRAPGESAINFWDLLNKLVRGAVVACGLVLAVVFFLPVVNHVRNFQRRHDEMKATLQQEQQIQQKLVQEVQALQHDPEYNERLAREKLGLARPNEVIFRFPPLKKAETPVPSPTVSPATGNQSAQR